MSTNFFDVPSEEQLALISIASDRLDVSEMIIEKDLWVCWVLEKIFALPVQMAFKGGTSLSKVFGLINRFSEDCDVTIDYRNFSPDLNLNNLNRTQLKKVSDHLKKELKNYISMTVLPYLKLQTSQAFPKQSFEITLSDDGEQLRFYYPSITNTSPIYLRDHILIEFGVRNSTEPSEKYQIVSYLENINKELLLPKPLVDTLSPIRTFWEKATLIHVECHRDRFDKTPERLSRHWHDLFMLNNSWVVEKALSNRDILKNVISHKKAFFNASYSHYDECINGKFRLIPSTTYLQGLTQDFAQMVDAGMFHTTPPEFNDIIETLKNLETTINTI